jgi:hypothetical protein
MRWRGHFEVSVSCSPAWSLRATLPSFSCAPLHSNVTYHLCPFPPGIHAEVRATLLEAIARPPGSALGAIAFLAIFRELPPELRFYLSELVARRAAEALAIGSGSELAEDAPGAPLLAGGAIVRWGAAARGRNVLPLLRHSPPPCVAWPSARASDAAVGSYCALLGGAPAPLA